MFWRGASQPRWKRWRDLPWKTKTSRSSRGNIGYSKRQKPCLHFCPNVILARVYERCVETSLVISNISTTALPPKTFLRASSATMLRFFLGSWRFLLLMYTQSFFTTSERGIGPLHTIIARLSLTLRGFMNAEFSFAMFLKLNL